MKLKLNRLLIKINEKRRPYKRGDGLLIQAVLSSSDNNFDPWSVCWQGILIETFSAFFWAILRLVLQQAPRCRS